MLTMKNVLVATDFGAACEETVRYGREFALLLGARLHLLHALPPLAIDAGGDGMMPGMATVAPLIVEMNELEQFEKSKLEALLSSSDKRQLRALTAVEVLDSPAHAIVAYAKEHAIDLIVIGANDRSGLARFFAGSVGDSVVHAAPCPVLTVPASASAK